MNFCLVTITDLSNLLTYYKVGKVEPLEELRFVIQITRIRTKRLVLYFLNTKQKILYFSYLSETTLPS